MPQGVEIDEIDCVKIVTFLDYCSVVASNRIFTDVLGVFGVNLDLDCLYINSTESRAVVYLATICGGLEYYIDPNRDNRPFYRRRPNGAFKLMLQAGNLQQHQNSSHAFTIATAAKKFAATKDGYFALVPEQSQSGNLVTIFAGGRVPIIIRRLSEAPGFTAKRYKVLSDAYIHDIMDGEAFQTVNPDNLVDFILV
jgi:hypothetical protein